MNATERGRRSDALYYDTQVTNRRALCDMIANRESDLTESKAENAKLREQMERLVTLLRVDCDIDASWDGLRRFWSIGLTEDGCLMRDRACKAEAENAKLRERIHKLEMEGSDHFYRMAYAEDANRTLEAENAKLRELVRDAWGDGHPDRSCEGCDIRDEYPNAESIDDIDPDDFNDALKNHEN